MWFLLVRRLFLSGIFCCATLGRGLITLEGSSGLFLNPTSGTHTDRHELFTNVFQYSMGLMYNGPPSREKFRQTSIFLTYVTKSESFNMKIGLCTKSVCIVNRALTLAASVKWIVHNSVAFSSPIA